MNLDTVICRLQYPYRIIRNRLLGKLEPIIVVLVVNNKCNFKCRYCFGDYCNRKDNNDYTTQELKDIIGELHAMGTRVLTVHGGETLLRNDIAELVDFIKSKRIYLNFITNGTLLKKKVEELRKVDSLCISLDGNKEGNDLNRGKNTFEPTLAAIKFAKKEGFHLRVQATITKYTMHDIEFLAKLAREIGYFQEFSILYQTGGVNDNYKELMLTDEETKNVIREIIKWKKLGYPIFTAYDVLYNALNWQHPFSKPHLRKDEVNPNHKTIPCYYGLTKFTVDANGFVYPCFALMESFSALNIRDVGVRKAIQNVIDNNVCVRCVHFTNNDHNLLLGLSCRQIASQCVLQVRELLGNY